MTFSLDFGGRTVVVIATGPADYGTLILDDVLDVE
jgi:hypothetical protein